MNVLAYNMGGYCNVMRQEISRDDLFYSILKGTTIYYRRLFAQQTSKS